jgi:hypothetical protein
MTTQTQNRRIEDRLPSTRLQWGDASDFVEMRAGVSELKFEIERAESIGLTMLALPMGIAKAACGYISHLTERVGAVEAGAAPASAEPVPVELPAVLFDGKAVYDELLGRSSRTSAANVTDVLDAVARLMRRETAPTSAPSRQAMLECALRQIIDADDAKALTQELIEAGRRALAWRAPSVPSGAGIDTPEFRALEADFVKATVDLSTKDHHGDNAELFAARAALIAHIDAHCAQMAQAKAEEVRNAAQRKDAP